MKKAVLISGHFYKSKRKAGFHLISEAFTNSGYATIFITAPCSYLFRVKKDHYSNKIPFKKNKVVKHETNVYSYIHFTLFHVFNFKNIIINYLTCYLFKIYQLFTFSKELKKEIKESNIIILESTPGLFLFNKLKKLNPNARYVYRVSDDLEILNAHPSLIKFENNILNKFDLVSVPSQYIFDKLKGKSSEANIRLHYHGINKELYDSELINPYRKKSVNAVFIGVTGLDYKFLEHAALNHLGITFHIIGPLEEKVKYDNIKYYGEMPFEKTIPYVKYADIGLHTIEYSKGAESFTDSLKVHQYTYCGLPIISSYFLKSERKNSFYYKDNQDIELAIKKCFDFGKNEQLKEYVSSWEELRLKLLTE